MKESIENLLLKILSNIKFYPNTSFLFSPFKIFEFYELLKNINIDKKDIILDVGCGTGRQTLLLSKMANLTIGVDTSKGRIDTAKKRSSFLKKRTNTKFYSTDLQSIKFPDHTFDNVFSFCVLEHIPNYHEVIKEIHRILRKGGSFSFSVDSLTPIKDEFLISKHKATYKVEKIFNKNELKNILQKIGFHEIQVYPIFKSVFAKKLFVKKVMKKEYHFGYLESLLLYLILKQKERKSFDKEGMFLVAKCKK